MGSGKWVLNLVKPFQGILPEVEQAKRKVQINEKIMWTAIVLFVFLICAQIPLAGLRFGRPDGNDPFYFMRTLLASNRGTLMELGISPIVTSGLVMQLLVGAKLIEVGNDKDDKALFQSAQKLLGIIITIIEAVAYVVSGMYGNVGVGEDDIGAGAALLIIFQLVFAGIIVLCLDELLQKGWGLGSGISLFIATNICENIMWQTFSPEKGRSGGFQGALVALFHLLMTRQDRLRALQEAFYRADDTNVTNLLATVLVFLLVVFFQGFAVRVRIKHANAGKGVEDTKKIKLFYTSNMPIILLTALVSNVHFFSSILHRKFPENRIVGLFGRWDAPEMNPTAAQQRPVAGLAYYLTAPVNITAMVSDPIHAIVYIAFMLTACSLLSRMWIEVSGSSAKDVARQMKEQKQVMPGFRDSSIQRRLEPKITTAATLGGLCIGAMTIIADFMGAIGSGTGILLAVTTIYEYYETIKSEQQGDSFSFRSLLGK